MYIHYIDGESEYESQQIKKIHRLGLASDARDLPAGEAYGNKRVYFHARFMRGGLAQ